MFDPRELSLSFRTIAILPIILFIPSLVSFAIAEPGVVWPEYSGIFFHLAILLLITRMDAPEWAKAAGYGWITLDVLTGILSINDVPYDITWPVRLGGHVLAGTWILFSSAYARQSIVRIVGGVTGVWLAGYSFVANIAPESVLCPAALLIVVWFAILAVMYQPSRQTATDFATSTPVRPATSVLDGADTSKRTDRARNAAPDDRVRTSSTRSPAGVVHQPNQGQPRH